MTRFKNGFWPNLALMAVLVAVPHLYSLRPAALYSPLQIVLFFGGALLGGLVLYTALYYLLTACFLRKCPFYRLDLLFPAKLPFAERFLVKKILLLLGFRIALMFANQLLLGIGLYYYAAFYLLEALHWLVAYALLGGKGRKIGIACIITIGLAVVFAAAELLLVGQYHDLSLQLMTAEDFYTIIELSALIERGELISGLLNMACDLLMGAGLLILSQKNKTQD